jgi:hypothetical protein
VGGVVVEDGLAQEEPRHRVPRPELVRLAQVFHGLGLRDPAGEERDARRLVVETAQDAVPPALLERGIERDHGLREVADAPRHARACGRERALCQRPLPPEGGRPEVRARRGGRGLKPRDALGSGAALHAGLEAVYGGLAEPASLVEDLLPGREVGAAEVAAEVQGAEQAGQYGQVSGRGGPRAPIGLDGEVGLAGVGGPAARSLRASPVMRVAFRDERRDLVSRGRARAGVQEGGEDDGARRGGAT